jgi:hypothetical protein
MVPRLPIDDLPLDRYGALDVRSIEPPPFRATTEIYDAAIRELSSVDATTMEGCAAPQRRSTAVPALYGPKPRSCVGRGK